MDTDKPTVRRIVSVEAEPEPISIDIGRTAALVVDMQNDFGAKGGMFDRAGIDISITRAIVEPTAKALDSMRRVGIDVIYLKMGYVLISPILAFRTLPTASSISPWQLGLR